jgi:hypothetical protein
MDLAVDGAHLASTIDVHARVLGVRRLGAPNLDRN